MRICCKPIPSSQQGIVGDLAASHGGATTSPAAGSTPPDCCALAGALGSGIGPAPGGAPRPGGQTDGRQATKAAHRRRAGRTSRTRSRVRPEGRRTATQLRGLEGVAYCPRQLSQLLARQPVADRDATADGHEGRRIPGLASAGLLRRPWRNGDPDLGETHPRASSSRSGGRAAAIRTSGLARSSN